VIGPVSRPTLEALRRVTSTLLDVEQAAGTLRPVVLELSSLLREAGTLPDLPRECIESGETRTRNGLAVSPTMAAMCADDVARTVTFIRGAHAAIAEACRRCPGRPISVLYAGCGPYATLAVPLMSIYDPGEVIFTLLDIHRESVESARSIVESLGLGDFASGFEVADAGSYRILEHEPPDVILLEVMQSCLESEPQVAVTRNLLDQAPGAILVPTEVRIDLELVDLAREFDPDVIRENRDVIQRDRIPLGPVFVLNPETVRSWRDIRDNQLPVATVRIPSRLEPRYQPMLFTVITAYEGHVLRDYDSGLSCPRQLRSRGPVGPGDTLRFRYELGAHPRLVAEPSRQGLEPQQAASA
jgi:hypothetical protein